MNMLAARRMVLASLVATYCDLKGSVLDVGCGAAPYKRLDFDAEWVTLDSRPVGDIEADMCDMPLPNECFDAVLCADALQYASDPAKAVGEMARVLRPGGKLYLIAPNCQQEDSAALWGFRAAGIDSLARGAGLDPEALFVASKQWEYEWANFGSLPSVAGHYWPDAMHGWIGHLDEAYPAWTVLVAVKP